MGWFEVGFQATVWLCYSVSFFLVLATLKTLGSRDCACADSMYSEPHQAPQCPVQPSRTCSKLRRRDFQSFNLKASSTSSPPWLFCGKRIGLATLPRMPRSCRYQWPMPFTILLHIPQESTLNACHTKAAQQRLLGVSRSLGGPTRVDILSNMGCHNPKIQWPIL